ncbi:type II toxin-antitoxin system RelE/ParE family toxin [Bdellovibrio sp. BCCA]|uniref:type II toxin-antitoxin system RelE/ParE family toxin n=1 Tax=Bdellovibrio sp. BCCA TaxID=3136281 RepID=UPI0030F12F75
MFVHPVFLHPPAQKEIQSWPLSVKKDLGGILTQLQKGEKVGFPDTRAMSAVAPGVIEIRLKGTDGIFRAFYILKSHTGIIVFHAFQKKSQKTPRQEIETGRIRLADFLRELQNEEND